jgi:hypothetical protein
VTTYATAADYAAYLGLGFPGDWDDAEIARIDAGLLLAQEDVDGQIYFSTYDADDATIQDALTRATSARFRYLENTGSEGDGSEFLYDSVRVGPVALSRSTDKDTVEADPLAVALGQRAATILRNAGFIVSAVSHT